jgi:hypothetical protein
MSVLLFFIGAIAIVVGSVMIAFGIPINEFSFGNTLIAAGVTAFMGGLVILALAAVVAQLQRVVDALAARPALRPGRPMEAFEQPARSAAVGRVPFPPKPKAEAREAHAAETITDMAHAAVADALSVAPTLHNPDEPPVAAEETEMPPPLGANGSGEKHQESALDTGWRAPPPLPPLRQQSGLFESMWPAPERKAKAPPPAEPKYEAKLFEAKPFEAKPYEAKPEAKYEPKPDFRFEPKPEPASPEAAAPPKPAEPERPTAPPAGEMRAVAILKSGVVDGMGYTLYVDGSIEAELPQGTLRFASINELRRHLEKHS